MNDMEFLEILDLKERIKDLENRILILEKEHNKVVDVLDGLLKRLNNKLK